MNKILQQIVTILQQELTGIQAIYIYGSYGTVDTRPDSDLDLGILLTPSDSKGVSWDVLLALKNKVSHISHTEVDIVNMRQSDTIICKEIIMAERCIYSGDTYARQEFEMLTLSYYQKLNEERADIIKVGIESGRFV